MALACERNCLKGNDIKQGVFARWLIALVWGGVEGIGQQQCKIAEHSTPVGPQTLFLSVFGEAIILTSMASP